jgi:hypothetical protein
MPASAIAYERLLRMTKDTTKVRKRTKGIGAEQQRLLAPLLSQRPILAAAARASLNFRPAANLGREVARAIERHQAASASRRYAAGPFS